MPVISTGSKERGVTDVVAEVRRIVPEKVDGRDAELCVDADGPDLYSVTVTPRGSGAPFVVYAEQQYIVMTVGEDVRLEFEGAAGDIIDSLGEAIDDVVCGGAVELFIGRVAAGGWIGSGRRSSSTLLTPIARLLGRQRRYGPYEPFPDW